jgi:hypothetical protein
VLADAPLAFGQIVESPPGVVGGIFGGRRPANPNRNSQSLETTIDISAGNERDSGLIIVNPDSPGVPNPQGNWFGSTAGMTTRYFAGSARRSIDASGRGLVNYQDNTESTLKGGDASVNAIARFGRRRLNQLTVGLQAAYQPGWIFGATNPDLDDTRPALGLAPEMGMVEERWFSTSGTARYTQHWGTHHQNTFQFGGGTVRPVTGSGVETEWFNALVTYDWTVGPRFSVTSSYRHDRSQQLDQRVAATPIEYQTLDAGVTWTRRLSPARHFSIAITGGATRLLMAPASPEPAQPYHPIVSAGFELMASRTWSVSTHVSRSVSVLAGISAAPMVADGVDVGVSGTFGRRLRFAASGMYLLGASVGGHDADGIDDSSARGAGSTAELRYGLGPRFGLFTSYSYYRHDTESASRLESGVPSRYDRHSARVGVTMWLPLYGSF